MKSQYFPCREIHLPPECDNLHYWDNDVKKMFTIQKAKASFTTDSNIVNPGEID